MLFGVQSRSSFYYPRALLVKVLCHQTNARVQLRRGFRKSGIFLCFLIGRLSVDSNGKLGLLLTLKSSCNLSMVNGLSRGPLA